MFAHSRWGRPAVWINATPVYHHARVVSVLVDFGCSVVPRMAGRIRPADKDICLSILDYALPDRQETSPTRALNTLANRVVRTVCVGSDEDLQVCRGIIAAAAVGAFGGMT